MKIFKKNYYKIIFTKVSPFEIIIFIKFYALCKIFLRFWIWIQICFFGFLPLLLGLLGTGAGALGTGVVVFVWLHLSLKLGGSFEILVQHSTIFWSHSHNALPHGLSTIFAIFCKNFNF